MYFALNALFSIRSRGEGPGGLAAPEAGLHSTPDRALTGAVGSLGAAAVPPPTRSGRAAALRPQSCRCLIGCLARRSYEAPPTFPIWIRGALGAQSADWGAVHRPAALLNPHWPRGRRGRGLAGARLAAGGGAPPDPALPSRPGTPGSGGGRGLEPAPVAGGPWEWAARRELGRGAAGAAMEVCESGEQPPLLHWDRKLSELCEPADPDTLLGHTVRRAGAARGGGFRPGWRALRLLRGFHNSDFGNSGFGSSCAFLHDVLLLLDPPRAIACRVVTFKDPPGALSSGRPFLQQLCCGGPFFPSSTRQGGVLW